MGENLDYVTLRKLQLKAEMAWLEFCAMWKKLAKCEDHKRNAEYHAGAFNAIRSQYIKRGRKPGSKVAA